MFFPWTKIQISVSLVVFFMLNINLSNGLRKYTKDDILKLREEVRHMFQHAYEGYLKYASKYDELRPISCDGVDTWGSYSLTLIDALDTLAVMGNYTEFRRVVDLLSLKSFDSDINVSVFETNIRIVGGLISAHLMSHKAGIDLEPGWPCNGPLLRLAEDVARRLLPAFDTKTGMPYGTVNLKYGVPYGETSVTCTAGIGTFIVEFGALSRLTGDPIYEEVALNALYALYSHRSSIGLFGNHIDVLTGRWTAQDAGIGAGVDSYYEYLVKGAIMLNRPELMQMFNEGRKAIDKYLKRDDWHVWVSMNKGQVTLPVFQSLEAYWPGVLSLFGDTSAAMKTLHNYHTVWRQYGFLPEFYNIPNAEAGANRENYPLRPELIESVMYLYRSTGDPYLLEVGEDILRSIEHSAKTPCGYATIKNVRDHHKEDRMESFFLAETTKYLYLLFDPDNFIHNDGRVGTVISTPNGECVIEAGGYIFNTEAHPIDPAALRCCHDVPRQSLLAGYDQKKFEGDLFEFREKDIPKNSEEQQEDLSPEIAEIEDEFIGDEVKMKVIETKQAWDQLKKHVVSVMNVFNDKLSSTESVSSEKKEENNTKDDSLIVPVDKIDDKSKEINVENVVIEEVPVEIIKLPSSARDSDDKSTTTQAKLTDPSSFLTSFEDEDDENDENSTNNVNEEIGEQDPSQNDINASGSGNGKSEKDIINMLNTTVESLKSSNSTITEFVQSMLKSKTYQKTKFDAQDLLNKIKENGHYRNGSWSSKYQLLTCRAQPYLQRITVLGEFY